MPGDLAEDIEIEIAYDAFKNCAHAVEIGKRRGVAPACIDEPFGSKRHSCPQITQMPQIIQISLCNLWISSFARERCVRED